MRDVEAEDRSELMLILRGLRVLRGLNRGVFDHHARGLAMMLETAARGASPHELAAEGQSLVGRLLARHPAYEPASRRG
jgi:hypothetical protein